MNYIPLCIKTSYSIFRSLCDIKKLVSSSKKLGIKALAITDNNLFGVMEFYKECIKNDIKPIIGFEVIYNNCKILLYAKNYKGYQNLCRLNFIMQDKEIDIEDLNKYSSNLICITNEVDIYNSLTKVYVNLYLGYNNDYEQKKHITKNLVYINEVISINKEDIAYIKYLYLIRDGKKIDNINSYNISHTCYLEYHNKNNYKIEEEISSMCSISFPYNHNLFPKYDVEDSKEYLLELSKKGLVKKFGNKIKKSYYDRLLYELEVIDKMNYNDCFLVVYDYVKYARKNNVLVGPGRGSAACSLVSYALGITEVDPLKYDLLFERFLNLERISMPDIDIDFESNNREKVINYVIDKYSNKRVVPIITFSSLSGRQVIRDIGKILEVDTKKLDIISKYIGVNSLYDSYKNNMELKKYIASNNLETLMEISLKLDGLKRQISIHAAGIVISNLELCDYIPLNKYNDNYISGYSMEHLEELGLLKLDFLGIKDLTLIDNVLKKIDVDYYNIPLDDKKTLYYFQNAYTDGIFQFESDGMKNFLKKLKPDSFNDIIAAIALFRPGPSSNIDSYIKRKHGREKIDYIHEDLKDILMSTYGIIIYQEQIMQIANKIANYTLGEADVLRRAISKKKMEVLIEEEAKFIRKSVENGYSKELAKKIYDFIFKFANYGFNKAHSVGYSIMSFRMTYLKANYPLIFMSELLTDVIGQDLKTKKYIDECKKMSINILKPDVNQSNSEYKIEVDGIRYSFSSIKNIGVNASNEIIKIRGNRPFTDFFDFVARTYSPSVNRLVIESLIDSGAFDLFNYNHNTLINNIDLAINYAEVYKTLDESVIEKPIMKYFDEFSKEELSKREVNIFGFYLTNHPVSNYKAKFDNIVNTNDIKNFFNKEIDMVLYVDYIREIKTKNNKQMAFLNCSDEFGSIEVVMFPNLYEKIEMGTIMYVKGRVERNISKYQLVLSSLKKL